MRCHFRWLRSPALPAHARPPVPRPRLLAFIESKPYFTLVVLTTLFALFIGDMRTLVVPMEGDSAVR